MILVIDNYDSFTYNLVQYLGELGAEVVVRRNDAVTVSEVEKLAPSGVLISPGPGRPEEAGVSLDIIEHLGSGTPIFGVCLGHQSIAQCFGASVVRADRLMHGRTSEIIHKKRGVFKGLPSPLTATRYHSLIVKRDTIPKELEISAWTEENEVMGLRHLELPIEGVQFHPESFLTEHGHQLIRNWLSGLSAGGSP
ncbi:MAG: aminodeoxychorismate/anthranilate synthase component II [Myxococcales bacterium]|nr:aminodeoxychorismate/anthranilate synthase component II [Myxococcales bacterium]MDH3844710.1 aminodeoxychorismate/anthranilate synthase component II [Myxococcales bacterium]